MKVYVITIDENVKLKKDYFKLKDKYKALNEELQSTPTGIIMILEGSVSTIESFLFVVFVELRKIVIFFFNYL